MLGLGRHLLVQAGTGTGKSLGYLAPALLWLVRHPNKRIVVATATLALQSQLANNDIPAALDAVESSPAATGTRSSRVVPTMCVCFGCGMALPRIKGADPSRRSDRDHQILAAEYAGVSLGRGSSGPRAWAEGRRHTPAWPTAMTRLLIPNEPGPRSRSRSGCLGAQRCPYGDECFVESSRDAARAADLVVTNHALLAINAMHGGTALPEHSAVIIDEAHELVSRVTGAASAELSPQMVERVAAAPELPRG